MIRAVVDCPELGSLIGGLAVLPRNCTLRACVSAVHMRSMDQARLKTGVTVDEVGVSLCASRDAGNIDTRVKVAAACGQVSGELDIACRRVELDIGAATDGAALVVICAAWLAHAARPLSGVAIAGAFCRADLVSTVGTPLGNEVLVGFAAAPRL